MAQTEHIPPPLMPEPVLVFRVHKKRVVNEYWIFDVRVHDPSEPDNTYEGPHRWPFRLIRKNSRGGWKTFHWAQTYNAAYAYAHKRAGSYLDRGINVEKLTGEMGQVAYVQALNCAQAFHELIDRATKATSENRMKIVDEINAVLALSPVLEKARDSLVSKESKKLGI